MNHPSLGSLAAIRDVRTRSISPENFTGAPGQGGRATEGLGASCARDLGVGWKISPCIDIEPGETFNLASIEGSGVIRHIWITTHPQNWRSLILRAHWDNDAVPAVEVPFGDFFCNGWGEFSQVNSQPVAANPHGGFNVYWPMPFRQAAQFTLENVSEQTARVYYQITYDEMAVDESEGYFHAQWRRSNPLPIKETHVLLDGIEGKGHYVGTYMAWGVNDNGWWGEGEIKFYMDGDDEFPTICGTGTEDYFGGAWDFELPGKGYTEFSTPYLGLNQVIKPDGLYAAQQRFGMYRWHVVDPIAFHSDLKVDIQALGWRSGHRYLPLHDDISSMTVFYLDRTHTTLPPTPTFDSMEVFDGHRAGPHN